MTSAVIELEQIPNQQLQVNINDLDMQLDITISQLGGLLIMNLSINDNVIFKGMNCKANINMLRDFQHKINSNSKLLLAFECNNSIFDYTKLSNGATLYYAF